MSSLECPECRQQVQQADACSNCGYPFSADDHGETEEPAPRNEDNTDSDDRLDQWAAQCGEVNSNSNRSTDSKSLLNTPASQPDHVSLANEFGSSIGMIRRGDLTSFIQHRFVRHFSGVCIGAAGPALLLLLVISSRVRWPEAFIMASVGVVAYFLIPRWIRRWMLTRRFPFVTGVIFGVAAISLLFTIGVADKLASSHSGQDTANQHGSDQARPSHSPKDADASKESAPTTAPSILKPSEEAEAIRRKEFIENLSSATQSRSTFDGLPPGLRQQIEDIAHPAGKEPSTLLQRGGLASPKRKAKIEAQVPVLMVSTGKGKLSTLTLTLERTEENRRLQVAVVEDTPSGAGDSLRASVWQATAVVALERQTTLNGHRLLLETSGLIDGPSAGAVIALALMSTLDGKVIPTDFVFTGTLLPDGSIGPVGGLVAKFEAAAIAGKKRMLIPSFLRFVQHPKTAELVDLRQLAVEHGLKLIPVNRLKEAYQIVHGAKVELPSSLDRLPPLADELDAAIVGRTIEWQRQANKAFDALDKADREAFANTLAGQAAIRFAVASDELLRPGFVLAAHRDAWLFHSSVHSYVDASAQVEKVDRGRLQDFDEYLAQIVGMSHETMAELPNPGVLAKNLSTSWPPLAAQYLSRADATYLDTFICNRLLRNAVQLETKDEQERKNKEVLLYRLALLSVTGAEIYRRTTAEFTTDYGNIVTLLPKLQPSAERVDRLERMLRNTARAATSALLTELAQGTDATSDSMREMIEALDSDYVVVRMLERITENESQRLAVDSKATSLERIANALRYARIRAFVSGIHVRWLVMEPDIVDGKIVYSRLERLPTLLRTARTQSIANIVSCEQGDIPCPSARTSFELAESRSATDDVGALTLYWDASLRAQLLHMMFAKQSASASNQETDDGSD